MGNKTELQRSDKKEMKRSKRKTNSPLVKEGRKSRRTEEVAEDDDCSETGLGSDTNLITDLKEFIRAENARSNRTLSEEIRRYNDERITAVENSLSFALTASETLSKRLNDAEKRTVVAEKELFQCAQRLTVVEDQLDQLQQKELQDWLIFTGPAVQRSPRARGENLTHILNGLVRKLMNYDMDLGQIRELHREGNQIRVRFNTMSEGSDRFFFVRNKTRLRGTGLYIRERLTPYRQRIFNELVYQKKNKQISTMFTKEGTVFVVVSQRDRPRPVRSEAALQRLYQHLVQLEQADGQRTGTSAPSMSQGRASPGTGGAREGNRQVSPTTTEELHPSPRPGSASCDRSNAEMEQDLPGSCGMGAAEDQIRTSRDPAPGDADQLAERRRPADLGAAQDGIRRRGASGVCEGGDFDGSDAGGGDDRGVRGAGGSGQDDAAAGLRRRDASGDGDRGVGPAGGPGPDRGAEGVGLRWRAAAGGGGGSAGGGHDGRTAGGPSPGPDPDTVGAGLRWRAASGDEDDPVGGDGGGGGDRETRAPGGPGLGATGVGPRSRAASGSGRLMDAGGQPTMGRTEDSRKVAHRKYGNDIRKYVQGGYGAHSKCD